MAIRLMAVQRCLHKDWWQNLGFAKRNTHKGPLTVTARV